LIGAPIVLVGASIVLVGAEIIGHRSHGLSGFYTDLIKKKVTIQPLAVSEE
jgi:hypothetical protein